MLLLVRGDLHRMANLRRINRVGNRRRVRQGRDLSAAGPTDVAADEKTDDAADRQPSEHRRDTQYGGTRRVARGIGEARRHCFLQHGIEPLVQQGGLVSPGADLLVQLRALGQPSGDRHALGRIEPAVGISMQLFFGNRVRVHLTTFNCAAVASSTPLSSARRRSLPRDRRDITVPIGEPMTAAVSS